MLLASRRSVVLSPEERAALLGRLQELSDSAHKGRECPPKKRGPWLPCAPIPETPAANGRRCAAVPLRRNDPQARPGAQHILQAKWDRSPNGNEETLNEKEIDHGK